MTRRRKKHRPDEIVAKLRDAHAMLNAGKGRAAVLFEVAHGFEQTMWMHRFALLLPAS